MSRLKSTLRSHAKHTAVRAPPRAIDEMMDLLNGEVGRCATWATENAMLLESIATQSFALTGEIFRGARSAELLHLSHRMRGLVVHALGVLAELQCVAGRLDALAALKGVEPTLTRTDDEH